MLDNLLLSIGIIMAAGYLGGEMAVRCRLPRITGYIVMGMVLSPSLLNLTSKPVLESLTPFVTIGLAIIGYSIGGSLRITDVKKAWKTVALITACQGFFAWLLVTAVVTFTGSSTITIPEANLINTYFPIAFIVGATAWATAPAVSLAIVHECKARSSFITTMLSLVALTDAITVIAFAFALGMSQPLLTGQSVSFYRILLIPIVEVIGALLTGGLFALALTYSIKYIKTRSLLLVAVISIIILCCGFTEYIGLSSVLACMMLGFVVINKINDPEPLLVIEEIEDVIFIMFFMISCMNFNFDLLSTGITLALIITVTRCFGKYLGTYTGAAIMKENKVAQKYLGLTLLPVAGLTLGLAFVIQREVPVVGDLVFNSLLASVAITMLFSPPLAKLAVIKLEEASKPSGKTEPDLGS